MAKIRIDYIDGTRVIDTETRDVAGNDWNYAGSKPTGTRHTIAIRNANGAKNINLRAPSATYNRWEIAINDRIVYSKPPAVAR